MILLPKLLYILQMTPFYLTVKDVKHFYRILGKFFWSPKRARLAFSKLMAPRAAGGKGVANLRFYNIACLLPTLRDWLGYETGSEALLVEREAYSPHHLVFWLHSPQGNLPAHVSCGLVASGMRKCWQYLRRHFHLDWRVSYCLPLLQNPDFPAGIPLQTLRRFQRRDIVDISPFIDLQTNSMHSFAYCCQQYELTDADHFTYMRIRSYIHSCHNRCGRAVTNGPFQRYLHINSLKKVKLSMFYKLLHDTTTYDLYQRCSTRWGEALQEDIPVKALRQATQIIPKAVTSADMRDLHFRILHKLIIGPHRAFLAGIIPSGACPKCSVVHASLFHCLWECSQIQTFWLQIIDYNTLQWPQNLRTGSFCLLGTTCTMISQDSWNTASISSLKFLHKSRLVALRIILRHWITSTIPSMTEWKEAMLDLYLLERKSILTSPKQQQARFGKLWSPFLNKSSLRGDTQSGLGSG
ncbi:uncharacterized protein LOC115099249 [Rhinatrema bivittatum]|uniref:uncharacterized protein LOC115099249 n=1 Tax=Rhinatrema bivittatum TaxID=194408 RepID=UPI00112D9BE8|nr:uncharacterized protein LOC115099249 [Rhinatrema bivittatum]XP_029472596.1 uncharacterized protein LOC115099249 [Rhinatrema bivittatum]XP_029472597.1 uncharacterized protein LOC115099249 [Rhinatrema bivittatum]XP_029472598.1 uncharacterized protein LOC115099249 [Rhinatrema bivittatum]XP_029472599.1 uncharacterized protein LOC115099249 [Rhinatrema bivittatum]XP_029472600.1 uncharacterized protein LOC115099249 [Rhinatrema bivittatum]